MTDDIIKFALRTRMPAQGRFIHHLRLGRLSQAYDICRKALSKSAQAIALKTGENTWKEYAELMMLSMMVKTLMRERGA